MRMNGRRKLKSMAVSRMGPIHTGSYVCMWDRLGIRKRIPVEGHNYIRLRWEPHSAWHGTERSSKQGFRQGAVKVKSEWWATVYFLLAAIAIFGCSIAVVLGVAMVAK